MRRQGHLLTAQPVCPSLRQLVGSTAAAAVTGLFLLAVAGRFNCCSPSVFWQYIVSILVEDVVSILALPVDVSVGSFDRLLDPTFCW